MSICYRQRAVYSTRLVPVRASFDAVASLARDLFDRIKVFSGYMRDLGRSLQQAVERYNKGVGSLEVRVLPASRRFESLGIVPSGSEIPLLEPIESNARDVQT
jgi:DNA recombination protein RmuC